MIQIANLATGQRFVDAKHEVDRRFPAGRFVALEGSKVAADAETHRQLVQKLQSLGKSPKDMLVIQAGIDYPTSAVIF